MTKRYVMGEQSFEVLKGLRSRKTPTAPKGRGYSDLYLLQLVAYNGTHGRWSANHVDLSSASAWAVRSDIEQANPDPTGSSSMAGVFVPAEFGPSVAGDTFACIPFAVNDNSIQPFFLAVSRVGSNRIPTLYTDSGTYYVTCPYLPVSLTQTPQNVTNYPSVGLPAQRARVQLSSPSLNTWSFSTAYPTRIGIRPGEYMKNGTSGALRWIHNSANGLDATTTQDYVPDSYFNSVSLFNCYISTALDKYVPLPEAIPSVRSFDQYWYMNGSTLTPNFSWVLGSGRSFYNSGSAKICGGFTIRGKTLAASTTYSLYYEIPEEWYTTINTGNNVNVYVRSPDEFTSGNIYTEAGTVVTDDNVNITRILGPYPFPPYIPLSQLSPSASYLKTLGGATGTVTGDHGVLKGAT